MLWETATLVGFTVCMKTRNCRLKNTAECKIQLSGHGVHRTGGGTAVKPKNSMKSIEIFNFNTMAFQLQCSEIVGSTFGGSTIVLDKVNTCTYKCC